MDILSQQCRFMQRCSIQTYTLFCASNQQVLRLAFSLLYFLFLLYAASASITVSVSSNAVTASIGARGYICEHIGHCGTAR